MVELFMLGSGSRGNSTLIRTESSAILIDAGLSARQITLRLRAAGQDPERIEAILITHEHSDHVGGIRIFNRHYPTMLLANEATATAVGNGFDATMALEIFKAGDTFHAGRFSVRAFSLPHDAADPVGFVLEAEGVRIGFATDLGHISEEVVKNLSGCHIVVLESNHDRNMLLEGPYPRYIKQRIDSEIGHLSNDHAACSLPRIVSGDTRHLVLAHLSTTNNIPRLACAVMAEALESENRSDIEVHAARQNTPVGGIRC